MEKAQFIERANRFYPDGGLESTHYGLEGGDSLTTFIVDQLNNAYDEHETDEERLTEAKMRMHMALTDIMTVLAGLDDCKVWPA